MSGASLKRKDPRLRDWNVLAVNCAEGAGIAVLKRKDPRLRDWNGNLYVGMRLDGVPWKEKTLDYEIETPVEQMYYVHDATFAPLEKKRPSITRLKQCNFGRWLHPTRTAALEKKRPSITRLKQRILPVPPLDTDTWKEKTLDYEIETPSQYPFVSLLSSLKRKDPRLRDWNAPTNDGITATADATWKEKTLDYEIETR